MSFQKGERHSSSQLQKPSPKALKAKKVFTVIRLIASCFLFFSWVTDNYFQKKWEGIQQESMRHRSDASYVQQQETHLKYYIGLFTSLYYKEVNSSDSINHKDLVFEFMKSRLNGAYYDYCLTLLIEKESMALLVNVDKDNFSDDWLKRIRDTLNVSKQQLPLFLKNDVNFWNVYSSKLSKNIWDVIPSWYEHINKFDDSIAKKIKNANKVFLNLYIFGSLLFALAYYFKYRAGKLGYSGSL